MSRKPENTHIPIDQCKDGYAYRIDARNGSVGIYSAERKSFAIVRNKFGSTFIDEEFSLGHWGAIRDSQAAGRALQTSGVHQ